MTASTLPEYFIWSRAGDEAGETLDQIIARKEAARAADGGTFAWGFGAAPSKPGLITLLEATTEPQVMFTKVTTSKLKDQNPQRTWLYLRGVGVLDGAPYEIPPASLVTSGDDGITDDANHWAYICHSDVPLDKTAGGPTFYKSDLRNVPKGTQLGFSQPHAVVRHQASPRSGKELLRAHVRVMLVAPYIVKLTERIEVPVDIHRLLKYGHASGYEQLRAFADAQRSHSGCS